METAGFSFFSIPFISSIVGGLLVLLFFADYFRRRRVDISTLAASATQQRSDATKSPPSSSASVAASKKGHQHKLPFHSVVDKNQTRKHHHLDLNTLRGHGDSVTAISFSSDCRNLATSCSDGAIRVFRIDDASSKSFKSLRINLPAGAHPTAIQFSEGSSSVVVAAQMLLGSSLFLYADVGAKPSGDGNQQAKLPLPEIKWEHRKIHDQSSVINLSAASATYGSADGSTIIASCSEDTSIKLWHGKSGKELGAVDTNQLKNNMASLSQNGRFLAAAAFTADVKVWEIVYSKDASVKEVSKVMQLKGHKSAVTCLCFTPDSEKIMTASKDGSIRIWNINVRYHLDEDPKTLKMFPIPLHDSKGVVSNYDHISVSPDGIILATTSGSTLQWLCAESGKVMDTADKAHDGQITGIAWAAQSVSVGGTPAMVLSTSGSDKKVKLWLAPKIHPS